MHLLACYRYAHAFLAVSGVEEKVLHLSYMLEFVFCTTITQQRLHQFHSQLSSQKLQHWLCCFEHAESTKSCGVYRQVTQYASASMQCYAFK